MGLSRFLTVLGTEMDILDCGGRRARVLFPVVLYGGQQAAARLTRGGGMRDAYLKAEARRLEHLKHLKRLTASILG